MPLFALYFGPRFGLGSEFRQIDVLKFSLKRKSGKTHRGLRLPDVSSPNTPNFMFKEVK